MYLKTAGWMANCVEPDQMPRSAASTLGVQCLLRSVPPSTYSYYGTVKHTCLSPLKISGYIE